MARPGISYLDVARAAIQLKEQGLNPTVAEIRNVLKTGSNSTINRHLRNWEEKQGMRIDAEKGIPASLLTIVRGLYDALSEEANQKIHAAEQASQKKIALLQTQLAETNETHRSLRETNEQLSQEKAQLYEQVEIFQAKQQALQKELVQQQAENQAQITRLEDKAKEIDRISKQIHHAQANLEHYRETISQQRDEEKQTYEAKISWLEQKQEDNTKIISELNCVLATKNKEIEQLVEQHKILKNNLEMLSEEKTDQDKLADKTQLDFKSLQKSCGELEIDFNKKN